MTLTSLKAIRKKDLIVFYIEDSRGDSKSPRDEDHLRSQHTPDTTTSIDPNEFIKHTFGSRTKTELRKQAEDAENEYRNELIQR